MASVFEILKQGPSLSFKHEGKTFKLVKPWTDELLTELVAGKLVTILREMLGRRAWDSWKEGKKQKHLHQMLKDSFSTLGVDGDSMLSLIAVLGNEKQCRAFNYDLLAIGQSFDTLSMVEMSIILEGLPESSRLIQVQTDAKVNDWDRKEYMLADIADILNFNLMLTHMLVQMKGVSGKKLKAPGPFFKRPYEVEKEKIVFSSPVALKGLLDARRGANDGKGIPGSG